MRRWKQRMRQKKVQNKFPEIRWRHEFRIRHGFDYNVTDSVNKIIHMIH